MLLVRQINTNIIEIEEISFNANRHGDKHEYSYIDFCNMVLLKNPNREKKTTDELKDCSFEKCSDCLINTIETFYVPLMYKQEQQRQENKKLMEKETEDRNYYQKMLLEHCKLTNQWWNSRHSFDKYGRCLYNSDEIEIQLEQEHSLFSSITKLELLKKYYGETHVYATEYASNLIQNNPLYRKHIGLE